MDIEGIVEDLRITILPRRGQLHKLALGYAPRDPHYIVIAEAYASYPPQYRVIASEELAHIILEYEIWDSATLPEGFAGHELSAAQVESIEGNADYLCGALLCPKDDFTAQFLSQQARIVAVGGPKDRAIKAIVEAVAKEFQITVWRAARHAAHLNLLAWADHDRIYVRNIAM